MITKFSFQKVAEGKTEELEPGIVYVSKEDAIATLLCPCGCGDIIHLNLLTDSRPCWEIYGTTIRPSIQKLYNCQTHFSIVDGIVQI